MKTICLLAGARPNYMKIFPIWKELNRRDDMEAVVVHTGQHYDKIMSDVFFEEFDLPKPHHFLGVGSGTHGEQTGKALIEIERVLTEINPAALVVVGDVNSTVAGAMAAVKMGIPCAHVEAGLRSRDRRMPEEINRLITDAICDFLLTPSPDGDDNLIAEGIPAERIHCVGNVMIDSLADMLPKATFPNAIAELGVDPGNYIAVTLHRPSNVDDPKNLEKLLTDLVAISREVPVVFPAHPRTRKRIAEQLPDLDLGDQFHLLGPMGYLDFLGLTVNARLVITDSGGIQEETSYLGIPCITVRENTERPVTITEGTNQLFMPGADGLAAVARSEMAKERAPAPVIDKWDGKAAQRIVDFLDQSVG